MRRGIGMLAALAAAVMATGTVYVTAEPAQAGRQPEQMSASALAMATGKRVEMLEATSETRQVFAEPDGTFTMELSAEPVRVRKGNDWVAPDPTLARHSGGTVAPVAAASSVEFSGGGSEAPLVRLSDGTKWVELRWPGPLPEPVLSGDTATYVNVLPDVDLRVRATARGFSKVLVVKTRAAAEDPRLAKIRFGLATKGLTVRVNERGGLSATGADGEVVFESAKAQMWDATGTRGGVGRFELSAGQLTVIPDQKLLADPRVTYPIMIDPDFAPPGAGWTKVFSGNPNSSYFNGGGGDDGLAKVGYCGWAGCNGVGTARSFFQFDISALRGAQILGAEFNMHEVYAPSCSPRVFQVWQVGPIGAGTTWNNQPGGWWGPLGSPNVAYGYNSTCGPNWVGVPAGQSVINRLNDGSNVATFALRAADESDKYAWKKFDNGRLIVHYNWKPDVPKNVWTNVGQGPSLGCATSPHQAFTFSPRPTMHATLTDRDRQNLKAQFEWHAWGQGQVGTKTTTAQPNNTGFAWTIPSGHFANGSQIGWRVRGWDGYAWGPWTRWCGLTVDQTPPGRPSVTSVDYPQDQVAGYVGKTGAFTVRSTDTDVLGFQWALNFQDLGVVDVNSPYFVRATNGVATIRATPPREGRNDFYVRAVDRALNVSPVYQKPDGNGGWVPGGYGFTVGSAVPGPVGYWPLDGAHLTTEAADASSKGHTGTVSGIYPVGTAAWTTGRVGDALRFSGTSTGYVSTTGGPAVSTAGTFSVSAWVRLDTVDGAMHAAVSQDGTRVFGFYLGYVGDQKRFTFRMVPGDSENIVTVRANSKAEPKAGVWTHLTGMYDVGSKQMRLYVNGALEGTASLSTPWSAGGVVQIGRAIYAGTYGSHWPGAIDDVKVWSRLLADTEIQALANTPAVEEAFYPLDEGEGTRTTEISGNYRTATLTGGAAWVPGVVGGGAVSFDGADDAITTTQQAVRTDASFTVFARAKVNPNGSFQTVVSQDGPNSSGFALQYLPGGEWAMAVSPGDAANPQWIVAKSGPMPDSVWVDLAGVYDAAKGEVRLYVNTAEFIAPGRVNSHVPGNLVIGRAKQSGAGGLVAYFDGRIDDVHVYTGVRSKEDIRNDNLNPVTARPTVYSGQLGRFVNHDGRHMVTTGQVPPGMRFEGSLGLLAPPGAADTRMLYSCQYNGGYFVALSAGCEGHTLLSEIGLVYRNPPADIPTRPIYRCVVVGAGDHFNSHDEGCEGHRNEGLQGYTQSYRYLIRFAKQYQPYDHLTTSIGAPAGYLAEGVQGIVATSSEPNPIGLWSCADGADEFVAASSACEGKTVRHWIGNAWQEPPSHALGSMRLFACRTSSGDRFTSLDEFCEGQSIDGPLGYVVTSF